MLPSTMQSQSSPVNDAQPDAFYRVRNVDDDEKPHPPLPLPLPLPSMDLALHLNNVGVSHLKEKFYSGSMLYFKQARELVLDRRDAASAAQRSLTCTPVVSSQGCMGMDSGMACVPHDKAQLTPSTGEEWMDGSSMIVATSGAHAALSHPHQQVQQDQDTTPNNKKQNRTNTCFAQRSEYDEGMHALRGGIALFADAKKEFGHHHLFTRGLNHMTVVLQQHNSDSSSSEWQCQCLNNVLILLTIEYNLGQVCHAQGHCDEALEHYKSARQQSDFYMQLQHSVTVSEAGHAYLGSTNGTHTVSNGNDLALASSCMIPTNFLILRNIGYIYFERRQFLEATAAFNEAMEHASKEQHMYSYAINDYDIAATLNCIGLVRFYMPQPEQARQSKAMPFFEAALNIQRRLLVMPSASKSAAGLTQQTVQTAIATTLNNIGRAHSLNGEYGKAMAVYEEALFIRRGFLGVDSLDVAATIYNQGKTCHQLGELDMALRLYHDFLQIVTMPTRLGWKHKDVAVMLRCVAQIYHEQLEYEKAAEMYLKALNLHKTIFGNWHPEVGTTLNTIGNFYYEQDDLENAMKAYKEGLAVEERVLEENHPNISVTLSNIGQIHKHRGEYKQAVVHYKEALRIQKRQNRSSSGSDGRGFLHPNAAMTMSNIAMIYYQTQSFDKALDMYQEALCIRVEAFGDEHLDVSSTLNSIGMVLFKKGNQHHDMAMEAFSRAYSIRKALLGETHKDVAIIMHNTATILLTRGDNDMALSYYKKALEIEKSALGEDHIDVSATLHHIGHLYETKGDMETALLYYSRALEIEQKKLGHNSRAVAKTFNTLANMFLHKGGSGRVEKAIACFSTALRIYRDIGVNDENLVIVGLDLYNMRLVYPDAAATA
jgi:tetratricopeptide (TPR) repeat protein